MSALQNAALQNAAEQRGRPLLWLAVALALGAALAAVAWQSGLVRGEIVADWQAELTAATGGPALLAALGVALLIGGSMIVLPCGFPALFAVPTLLEGQPTARSRLAAVAAFALGGIVPLALVGALLGLAGQAWWDLLADAEARKVFAAVVYPLLGLLALGYGLSELGLLPLRGALERLTGPALPSNEAPLRRAVMLGATFGAGMGIACPMPAYYALVGWSLLAGSPAYGAALLGAYGAGRMAAPVAVGLAVAAGVQRRDVSRRLVWLGARVRWISGGTMAALGAFLIVLFGGFLGVSLVA